MDVTAYRRALVPLDGSPAAEAILGSISRIACPLKLELVLLRVVPPVVTPVIEDAPLVRRHHATEEHEEAEAYVTTTADRLSRDDVRAVPLVRVGDPATEIVHAARECEADLIAMTTHGRGGLRRLLFGSVAEAVLRQTPVPVFLMRSTEAEILQRAA